MAPNAPELHLYAVKFLWALAEIESLIVSRTGLYNCNETTTVAMDNEYKNRATNVFIGAGMTASDQSFLLNHFNNELVLMKELVNAANNNDSVMGILTDCSDDDERSSKVSVYENDGEARAVRQMNFAHRINSTCIDLTADGLDEDVFGFNASIFETPVRADNTGPSPVTRKRSHVRASRINNSSSGSRNDTPDVSSIVMANVPTQNQFFTHPVAKNQGFVAILKGIPMVTANELMNEIEEEYGVKPIKITSFNTTRPNAQFGTYAVKFEKVVMDFTAIQEIKILFSFRCKWEKMKKKNKKPTICWNCCWWGHGTATCGCAPRCPKSEQFEVLFNISERCID